MRLILPVPCQNQIKDKIHEILVLKGSFNQFRFLNQIEFKFKNEISFSDYNGFGGTIFVDKQRDS